MILLRDKQFASQYTPENLEEYVDPDTRHMSPGQLKDYIAWEGSMITGLYINPGYRKQGLGSWLIDRSGATKLTVNKSRKDAIRLYSNLGFKVIIDSPKMLLMERK